MTASHASRISSDTGCVTLRASGRKMDIIKTVSALAFVACTVACSKGSDRRQRKRPLVAVRPDGCSGVGALSDAPADRETLQLRYPGVPQDYLIDYTNLINVPASLQPGTRVTQGR